MCACLTREEIAVTWLVIIKNGRAGSARAGAVFCVTALSEIKTGRCFLQTWKWQSTAAWTFSHLKMEMFHAYQSLADKNILRQCELRLHIPKLKQKSKLITLTGIVVVPNNYLKTIKNASVVKMVWHQRNPVSHSSPSEFMGQPCGWPWICDLCCYVYDCLSTQGRHVFFVLGPLTSSSPTFTVLTAQRSGLTHVCWELWILVLF